MMVCHSSSTVSVKTILLVEDEDGARTHMADVLERSGYHVLQATDAHEAVYLWRRQDGEVDLLLADIFLLGQSGPELAQELRTVQPDLKVLLMSGYKKEHLKKKLIIPEDSYFLPKPYTSQMLREAVSAALSGSDQTSML